MKYTILVVLFTLGFYGNVNSQISSEFDQFLSENYSKGSKEFLESFYQKVKYPMTARSECRIGILKTRLTINKLGEIDVVFLNKLGLGLEDEIERVLNSIDNFWVKSEDDSLRKFDFTIAWQIGNFPELKGDIKLSVRDKICNSNSYYMHKLKKLLQKEKYKKAKQVVTELLRRDPDSEEFKKLDQKIDTKLLRK